MNKQKLTELTSSIDFNEPYSAKGHRAIYGSVYPPLPSTSDIDHRLPSDYVDGIHSPDASLTITPPLVFYAARNILSPTFIIGQIPDLLNLLAAVESFRRFAALKSDEALEWQKYYEHEKTSGRAEDVRLLAANEVRALQRCVVKKDAQRREYIVLTRSLILLYIHYLWTAPESCLLAKRLNDFFPGSFKDIKKPSELLFHIDLSEDEKEYFKRLMSECQEWMNLVVDWEEKRKETCQGQGQSQEEMDENFADDFRDTFPQPSEPSEMARNVEIYLNKVEDIVRKLEQWFPPSLDG